METEGSVHVPGGKKICLNCLLPCRSCLGAQLPGKMCPKDLFRTSSPILLGHAKVQHLTVRRAEYSDFYAVENGDAASFVK